MKQYVIKILGRRYKNLTPDVLKDLQREFPDHFIVRNGDEWNIVNRGFVIGTMKIGYIK